MLGLQVGPQRLSVQLNLLATFAAARHALRRNACPITWLVGLAERLVAPGRFLLPRVARLLLLWLFLFVRDVDWARVGRARSRACRLALCLLLCQLLQVLLVLLLLGTVVRRHLFDQVGQVLHRLPGVVLGVEALPVHQVLLLAGFQPRREQLLNVESLVWLQRCLDLAQRRPWLLGCCRL